MDHADGGTDNLVAESERLRRELLRTAARMEVFSAELMEEARLLKVEAAEQNRAEESTDERGQHPAGGRPTGTAPTLDQHGDGTHGGSG